jgi:hypothetical protein
MSIFDYKVNSPTYASASRAANELQPIMSALSISGFDSADRQIQEPAHFKCVFFDVSTATLSTPI